MVTNSNLGMATLLVHDAFREMEWKNGKGISSEIAIFPADASFPADPFLWRLSSAQMRENGPFSSFPGYDRYLTLIKGEGGTLYLGSNSKKAPLNLGEVHRFKGEEAVTCEVNAGPISDLNLIFKRDEVQGKFEMIRLSKKPRSFRMEWKLAFIFVVSGTVSAEVFPGESKFTIQEGNVLQIQVPEGDISFNQLALLSPSSPDCLVILIEVNF